MCRRIACEVCGKPSFAGCGMHVEQVLADVPKADRCRCAEDKKSGKASEPKRESWLKNLFR